jgi:hypothetical protein
MLWLIGVLTISLPAQSSSLYCEDGWSLEIRKGKDICFKYDKKLNKRFEAQTSSPGFSEKKWKLIIDNEGFRDSWKNISPSQ